VAITAPTIGDGKTTTAINLAGTLAQSPASRVLLVDLDLRRPAVADRLGLADGGPALLQALLRPELTLADVVRPCPPFNLAVLTAGSATAAPYELLKSPRLGELMADARSGYDWIVLDTPPLVPVSDCRLIGKYVDTFLVVVAAHRTSRRLLEDGLGVLDPSSVLGLVFNGDDDPPHADYYTSDAPASGRQRWESSMLSPIARLRAIWGSRSGHDRRRGLDADGHATPWR
jgi:capsular exopolysaccharide synthesis family protein